MLTFAPFCHPTIAVLLVVATPSLAASEPIEGAFGLRLGERLSGEPDFPIGEISIVPPKPGARFDKFAVEVTTTSGLISAIWGRSVAESTLGCRLDLDTLVDILTEKYGAPEQIFDVDLHFYDGTMYTFGDIFRRSIDVYCATARPPEDRPFLSMSYSTLTIEYTDQELQVQGALEWEQLQRERLGKEPL